jgi:hypothetical protein
MGIFLAVFGALSILVTVYAVLVENKEDPRFKGDALRYRS